MSENLAARLVERAAAHPERPALVAGRGSARRAITYADLAARVARVAARLGAEGVDPGARVLLFVPMSIELYVALLAVLRAGAVAVFVDAWADRRRLDTAVAAARPVVFLGTPRAQALRLVSPAVRSIGRFVWVRRGFGAGDTTPPGGAPAAVAGADPALVTFTTGSTGRPKAAARSHAFLWAQHRVLAHHLGLQPDDVDLTTLPIFALNDLAVGCTCVLPDFDPRRPGVVDGTALLAQLRGEGVTTLSASPSFVESLLDACDARGETPRVGTLFTGGAPVLPALARRLARLPATHAHVVYGSTEAEPIASLPAAEMVAALDGGEPGLCAGRPVEGIVLRLVRPHDGPIALDARGWSAWEVPPGGTGEIVVAGEHVLGGYLDDPESDLENKVRDGVRVWHRTGDAGRLDAAGRLWLMGRVSQRIERNGVVHWPLPVEVAALGVPGVRHAAWLPVPSAAGTQAVLCVERAGGFEPADDTALRAAVAPAPVDRIVVLDHIPRDPRHASKTDVPALLRRLGAA